jgi:hypothetical protein
MAYPEGGERPRGALEPVRQTPVTPGEQARSHAEMVAAFRQAIRLRRQEGSNPRWPELGGRAQDYSAARIIREELAKKISQDEGDWMIEGIAPHPQRAEALDTILKAWDVIAYAHYVDANGRTEEFEQYAAGQNVAGHYEQTGQTTIALSADQRRILQALTEAADIPHRTSGSRRTKMSGVDDTAHCLPH